MNRFETFTILIAKISRCIKKIKAKEMGKLNLKTPHVSCLYYLHKQDGSMTAKELCDMCDEDKAAISRSIDYLEKHGFIACESKFEKRYRSPLFLTEKGKKAGEYIVKKVDGILDDASKGLTDGDRKVLYKSLFIISDNLLKLSET